MRTLNGRRRRPAWSCTATGGERSRWPGGHSWGPAWPSHWLCRNRYRHCCEHSRGPSTPQQGDWEQQGAGAKALLAQQRRSLVAPRCASYQGLRVCLQVAWEGCQYGEGAQSQDADLRAR
jgi:hypothetical protein